MRGRAAYWLTLACIVLVASVFIALAWFGAGRAITAQRDSDEARVETSIGVQALAFEQQISRQLLGIDQTLHILRHELEDNPADFDLAAWRQDAVLLNEVSGTLFLADADGVIRQSSNPAVVGANVSRDAFFRALVAQTDLTEQMYIGPTTQDAVGAGWHMDLALRLRHQDDSFAGVIGVTYQTDTLERIFHEAGLKPDDMIALVGLSEARLRAAVGPIAFAPDASLRGSAMLQMLQELPNGDWIGPSAPDGIDRIHAFRHVPGQDLAVVVGVERTAALASSTTWARGARLFAGGVTALVLLVALLLLREVRAIHRRDTTLETERTRLAASHAELDTARARADAKAAQLEATLAGMTDGVAMVDADHCLMEWNNQFAEIAGVPTDMLRVGVTMEAMVRAQAEEGEFGAVDVDAEVERRMMLLHSGRLSEVNERARPNGRVIELRRNYLPDGGMVTLYTDITAHKQVENALRTAREAAEQADAAKSRFLAIVSHEIRTPLNALLNALRLLVEAELAPPQRTLLELARQSGEALLALINDILDMSRLEAGQLALRRSVFALRPLLHGALEMLRPLAAGRGIMLRLALDSSVPPLLHTDPIRLRQVLLNLLGNAAKYAAPGEVLLIGEMISDDDGPMLRLVVRDQGPAIPEAERALLFQPFSQLDQPGAEVQPGSGLGLAICRLLATLLGGEVGCDTVTLTAMGQVQRTGNAFWLTLPLVKLPPDAALQTDAQPAPLPVLPRTRILLVEDVIASRIVVARQLRRHGHMVDTVGSGEEAIAAVRHVPYDLVLMDLHMPGMSGIDAARHIRQLSGPAGTVPLVALTATQSSEDIIQCRAAGMNALVSKPATPAELLEALARNAWPGTGRSSVGGDATASAAPVSVADSPVLSMTLLEELRQHLSPTTLGTLVEECLLDLRTRLPSLFAALGDGDVEAIVAVAHAMAGAAGSYGMAALDARLRAVMIAAREQGPSAASVLADGAELDLARTVAALRDFLSIETV